MFYHRIAHGSQQNRYRRGNIHGRFTASACSACVVNLHICIKNYLFFVHGAGGSGYLVHRFAAQTHGDEYSGYLRLFKFAVHHINERAVCFFKGKAYAHTGFFYKFRTHFDTPHIFIKFLAITSP